MVEGTAGPKEGNVITSISIRDPGPIPVPFELAYPMSAVPAGASYYLYAGIQDGDLAWVTPVGVSVKAPAPLTEGVELLLSYRPDLLKGAVFGTITGVGLDPTRNPDAYGTAMIIEVGTGKIVGFQMITPVGAVPVPFSVPYDPSSIDSNADYVAEGSVWDGTAMWTTTTGTPVITKGNAKSNVVLTVTVAPTPEPTPTATPAPTAEPTPAPSAAPVAPAGDDGSGLLPILVLVVLVGAGIALVYTFLKSRR